MTKTTNNTANAASRPPGEPNAPSPDSATPPMEGQLMGDSIVDRIDLERRKADGSLCLERGHNWEYEHERGVPPRYRDSARLIRVKTALQHLVAGGWIWDGNSPAELDVWCRSCGAVAKQTVYINPSARTPHYAS